jgi:two-component system chemotaxis response regulator CheY
MSTGTILVVEDELLLREIVTEWLEFEGYKVFPAAEGEEALRIAKANSIDAIITDMRMPVMDGLTFLKRLRALAEKLPRAILMSGFSGEALREAYDLGVEMSLPKPFTDHQLLTAVQRLFVTRRDSWRLPDSRKSNQSVQASFASPDAARDQALLAFGSGGFCLRSNEAVRPGPVRFHLDFTCDSARIAGQGVVQWIATDEAQMGIEIARVEPECLELVDKLTAGARGYIPRTAIPG